ncbi:MAG: hypothetical protein ACK5YO_04770 [Planctomyces sp.]
MDVPEDDRYVGYEGLAIEIARFFKGGPLPVSPEETLEIFALLQAAELSRAKQGATGWGEVGVGGWGWVGVGGA